MRKIQICTMFCRCHSKWWMILTNYNKIGSREAKKHISISFTYARIQQNYHQFIWFSVRNEYTVNYLKKEHIQYGYCIGVCVRVIKLNNSFQICSHRFSVFISYCQSAHWYPFKCNFCLYSIDIVTKYVYGLVANERGPRESKFKSAKYWK